MNPSRKFYTQILLLCSICVCVPLGLAACGGEAGSSRGTGADTPARIMPETLRIELQDGPVAEGPSSTVRGLHLHPGERGPYLTWLQQNPSSSSRLGTASSEAQVTSEHSESHESTEAPADASVSTWQVRLAQYRDDAWSTPEVVVDEARREQRFFANWADVPALVEFPGGLFSPPFLLLHWLEKIGDATYAYGARIATRRGSREPWETAGYLHDDTSPTEHGFVSYVRDGDRAWAFWLDGRAMADQGPMSLRAARVEPDGPRHPSQLLDDRVCECCPTDAALAADGPVVIYRNRTEDEIRDIWSVRWEDGRWSAPAPVHVDGWQINGCPVNGPAIAAEGERLVVAWYTGAGSLRRVLAVSSHDGGRTWSEPVAIDDDGPYGRVDVAFAAGVAWISWLGRSQDGPAVMLRAYDARRHDVEPTLPSPSQHAQRSPTTTRSTPPSSAPIRTSAAADSSDAASAPFRAESNSGNRFEELLGQPKIVALTSAARKFGFPKVLTHQEGLLLAWIEPGVDDQPSLRTARITFD